MKVQLTVCICKNSMLEKYVFVGKPNLHFLYHFYLKRIVFERTKFFNGQNFIKKCNENVSAIQCKITAKDCLLSRNPS